MISPTSQPYVLVCSFFASKSIVQVTIFWIIFILDRCPSMGNVSGTINSVHGVQSRGILFCSFPPLSWRGNGNKYQLTLFVLCNGIADVCVCGIPVQFNKVLSRHGCQGPQTKDKKSSQNRQGTRGETNGWCSVSKRIRDEDNDGAPEFPPVFLCKTCMQPPKLQTNHMNRLTHHPQCLC
jgi:hypothetical protein